MNVKEYITYRIYKYLFCDEADLITRPQVDSNSDMNTFTVETGMNPFANIRGFSSNDESLKVTK
jgi:hypothetical protein